MRGFEDMEIDTNENQLQQGEEMQPNKFSSLAYKQIAAFLINEQKNSGMSFGQSCPLRAHGWQTPWWV